MGGGSAGCSGGLQASTILRTPCPLVEPRPLALALVLFVLFRVRLAAPEQPHQLLTEATPLPAAFSEQVGDIAHSLQLVGQLRVLLLRGSLAAEELVQPLTPRRWLLLGRRLRHPRLRPAQPPLLARCQRGHPPQQFTVQFGLRSGHSRIL